MTSATPTPPPRPDRRAGRVRPDRATDGVRPDRATGGLGGVGGVGGVGGAGGVRRAGPGATAATGPGAPVAVRVLVGLVLAQALALVAGAVALTVLLVRGTDLPGPVVFMAVLALGVGALLAGAARALARGHRWARSPVLTVQILLVVLAVGWLGIEVAAWSIGVLVVGAVTGVLVVLPPVVAWTTGGGAPAPARPSDPPSR